MLVNVTHSYDACANNNKKTINLSCYRNLYSKFQSGINGKAISNFKAHIGKRIININVG